MFRHGSRAGRRNGGFTLPEVMVAVSVLSIALAGTMGLTMNMLRANAFSYRMTEAVTLAQDKVDEIMASRYSAVVSGNDTIGRYQRTWTVTADSHKKTVEVAVGWTAVSGQRHRAVLRTMVGP